MYAAIAIFHVFGDLDSVDKLKVKGYIDSCYNYDGGYGLRPHCESHAGAVYCAVAALKMMEF